LIYSYPPSRSNSFSTNNCYSDPSPSFSPCFSASSCFSCRVSYLSNHSTLVVPLHFRLQLLAPLLFRMIPLLLSLNSTLQIYRRLDPLCQLFLDNPFQPVFFTYISTLTLLSLTVITALCVSP
jgi:hypothetical protein